MRKQNAEFKTAFTSEASDLKNTDYFGFVELDQYACYVMADGIDDQIDGISAKLAVSAAIAAFQEAPSMSKRRMLSCLRAANKALLEAKSKMNLKASIMIVVTDYSKMRYGHAGNIRLSVYRDGFLKYFSKDQSLTSDLVDAEEITPDKVATHEERNNLYSYLGQGSDFQPQISKKLKLTNADAILLYTRGIWENVDEGEIKDVIADATDDPEKTVNDIEDLLLSRQPQDLHKYTLAAIFANKVYIDPNKKRKIRKVIMTIIPIVTAIAVITLVLLIRHNQRMNKIDKMELSYLKTIEYIQADNYIRAEEECKDALKLAQELKDKKMIKELGNYQILIETVISADEALDNENYTDALKLFQQAGKRARYTDNIGADYINDRLEQTANYMEVYDLIRLGDTLAQNLQYDEAEEKYLEAKSLAGKIYFDEGRTDAMEALEKLYTDQKEEQKAQAEKANELNQKQESGANYMSLGDKAYAQGDYETAKVNYLSAKQTFKDLGDDVQVKAAEEKIKATKSKIKQKETLEKEAEDYINQATDSINDEDYTTAKKYYLLAKDIYATLKNQDKVDEITRKMELLDIKEEEKVKQEEKEKEEAEKLAQEEAAKEEAAKAETTKADTSQAETAKATKEESKKEEKVKEEKSIEKAAEDKAAEDETSE